METEVIGAATHIPTETGTAVQEVPEGAEVKFTIAEPEPKPKQKRRSLAQIEDRVGGLEGRLDRVSESIEALADALTVNGQPIPPENAHLVPYAMTDQGIDEKNAKAPDGPRVRVTRAAEDMPVKAYVDNPWDYEEDPMKAIADGVKRPGMAYRFLSPTVVEKKGMRGWQYTKDAKGNPVKCGESQLAEMPQEAANKRNAHFQRVAAEAKREAEESVIENQDRLIREAAGRGVDVGGVGPLQPGEMVQGNTRHSEGEASIGIRSVRGNSEELNQPLGA